MLDEKGKELKVPTSNHKEFLCFVLEDLLQTIKAHPLVSEGYYLKKLSLQSYKDFGVGEARIFMWAYVQTYHCLLSKGFLTCTGLGDKQEWIVKDLNGIILLMNCLKRMKVSYLKNLAVLK